jgi:hypothetical protein
MKTRFKKVTRTFTLLLLGLLLRAVAAPPPAAGPELASPGSRAVAVSAVTLHAASGATIPFVTQNGQAIRDVPPRTLELPHLVLFRNGVLSDAAERTLILEVTGIDVPPTGVTVTLTVETLHSDPDSANRDQRIPVWQASRRIAATSGLTQTNVIVTFVHKFDGTILLGTEAIATPTDYFRYDVTVMDANHPLADPAYTFSEEYAFLMENQWIAPLPEVRQESPGAAPDELIVYYCDMFPFRKSLDEPATWLPREKVTGYVRAELVPQMMEAFRVQTDEWEFPWHDAWTSYRPEDGERLSVSLTDGQTWFHGWAPDGGHSGISLKVNGGNNAVYRTLTNGLMSTFHHELFHNLQRNINLQGGGNGDVGGEENAWQFFSEGSAVLAASVGQPRGQFTQTTLCPV